MGAALGVCVEDLDELLVSVPVHPSQVAALGAAMDRYGCESVSELASMLLLKAVQAERHRALLLQARAA